MALSQEQFQALRAKGLSTEQIVKFEKQTPARPFGEQLKSDVKQGAYGFANEALLNVPDLLTSKVPQLSGLNPGAPQDTSEKVSRFVGSGAGFVAGLPQKIGTKVVATVAKPVVKMAAKQIGKRFARGGMEAAIGSLASAPFRAMKEGSEFSPKDEAIRTGVAFGAGGLAGDIGARFSRGGKYIAARNQLKEAENRLSKLTSEITQIGDKKMATTLGKEIKPSRTYEELNKQIKQTTDEIFKHRDSLIKSSNQKIKSDEYLKPFSDWIKNMEATPEFAGRMDPVKQYFNQRMAYHMKNGMDLVGMEQMKENLQKMTKTLLESAAPTESQAVLKQGLNELRGISRKVIEKYVPEVKAINAKYEPLIEGFEGTGKMAEAIQKSVRPTIFQTIKSKIPHIGGSPRVDTGTMARELEKRLPSYTEEIASQSKTAGRASAKMAQLRPKQSPPSSSTSWTGAVRPRGPRPGSGLVTGPQPTPQITGPSAPIESIGPRRIAPTFFRGEGFTMEPPMTVQSPDWSSFILPESLQAPKLNIPEYSPVRPIVEPKPNRGIFPLESQGVRVEGPSLSPFERGLKTQAINRILERRRIFPPKNLEQ